MSKKTSLAAALQTFNRSASAVEERPAKPIRTRRQHTNTQENVQRAFQPPSRAGKKALIGYFDPGVSKQLKQIALDKDSTIQELLSEALNDFFEKHKKPTIA